MELAFAFLIELILSTMAEPSPTKVDSVYSASFFSEKFLSVTTQIEIYPLKMQHQALMLYHQLNLKPDRDTKVLHF
jgi:hypothetical protein